MKLPHRVALLGIVRKGGAGAEIGVFRARFSECMLEITRPKILYLFDAWRKLPGMLPTMTNEWHRGNLYRVMESMRAHVAAGVVRPVCCLSSEAPKYVPDGSLDWVYIDADHSYASCLADLCAWWSKVKPGGHVMGHDYHEKREPGVPKAVAEFRARHGLPAPGVTEDPIPSYWWVKP
uniref:Putative methyltransferase n=1 Tax=viral metagenome TaxID=1070528 RepID=A0A6H1ZF48_9ZZZZ